MWKPANPVRCALLNGSAWSTDKEYMRRYEGICDIFFVLEHRMRKEEMEEQFNKEVKQGWTFASDAARIIDVSASSEDRKHKSGGVSVANNICQWLESWDRQGRRSRYVHPWERRKNRTIMSGCQRGMRVFCHVFGSQKDGHREMRRWWRVGLLDFIATWKVARLTIQNRKLWLVDVATDRPARYFWPARM